MVASKEVPLTAWPEVLSRFSCAPFLTTVPPLKVFPAAPENVTSPVEATRNQLANARLAFLFWQDRASAVEEAYDVNAATQRACAAWARRQDP